jgi:hypothetical protein
VGPRDRPHLTPQRPPPPTAETHLKSEEPDWVEVGRCHVGEALSLEISRLVGHSGTTVTELVYRHQLKPVIQTGATVMDELFGRKSEGA